MAVRASLAEAAPANPEPAPSLDPRLISRAVERLLDGVADTGGRGLLLRGEETTPVREADLAPGTPEQIAAAAMLRLGVVAQRAAELLRDHPDAEVRRSAAVLAARAHPLVEGLAADGDQSTVTLG